jgi:tetratricopeptide (TPR) repeat protein
MDEPSGPRVAEEAGGDSDADHFAHLQLSAGTLDIETMFAEIEGMPRTVGPEGAEIDLTPLLDEEDPGPSPRSEPPQFPVVARESSDLEQASEDRRATSVPAVHSSAEREYERGIALREAGRIEESLQALEVASRSARTRFRAAASLGRIYRDQGTLAQAIEWFERAADAAAPASEDGYALLFELAEALEAIGETARALAVCLELQANAGEYGDVSARINRLTKAQARG